MTRTPQDDFWTVTPALDPPSPVRRVSAAGGLVVAAGASLHMLRPGSRRLRSRVLLSGEEVVSVAAEPWSPYRLAIATPSSVEVFMGHRPHEPVFSVGIDKPEVAATDVVWGRRDGNSLLFVRQKTGEVLMVDLEAHSVGSLTTPPVAGIAADAKGTLAMIDLNPVEPANVGDAWILPAGTKDWTIRWVDCSEHDEEKLKLYVAVHGAAFAYSLEPLHDDYVGDSEVSWEEENDAGDNSFESAPGAFQGPIAFQDERVIYAAHNVEGQVDVLRWARDGRNIEERLAYPRTPGADTFKRIARLGLDDQQKGTAATVTGLAWDTERQVLWAASPELGLLEIKEPPPARGKLASN